MVLSSSGGLFNPQGLPQDDGRIAQRWNQDGSEYQSFTVDSGTSQTVHTVTAGKVLYIQSLVVDMGSFSGGIELRDVNDAGPIRFQWNEDAAGGQNVSFFFDPPLKFETVLYSKEVSTSNGNWTGTGWEE